MKARACLHERLVLVAKAFQGWKKGFYQVLEQMGLCTVEQEGCAGSHRQLAEGCSRIQDESRKMQFSELAWSTSELRSWP